MKKSRLITVAIVVLSIGAAAFAVLSATGGGPGGPGGRTGGAPGSPGTPPSEQPVQQYAVRVAVVEEGTIEAKTKLNGEVVPRVSVEALPEVGGTVAEIAVDVGDRVTAGEVVAYVDPSRPGTRFQASPVTAPIAGTITAIYVDAGSTVGQTTPVLRVGTLDTLEIVVDVPERFVGAIGPDTAGTVVFSAFPDQPRSARVARLSPVIDPSSRSKEAAFALTAPWEAVQAGMFAEVTMVTDRRTGTLTVPVASVVRRGGQESVFVVEEETARLVPVETGISADGRVEILRGLSPGRLVVVEGQNLLEDGSPVRVVEDSEGDRP
jgi:membrane fusion protein, multidrug efflux system